MGLFQSGRSGNGRSRQDREDDGLFERDRPQQAAPPFRYRVVLSAKDASGDADGEPPRVVWVTNERDYALSLVARLNGAAEPEWAWIEAWNRADKAPQSRWIRRRE